MPYPFLRKATVLDYDVIWSLWMQSHVIPWMSFLPQSKTDFFAHYQHMAQNSTIYVLVDKVHDQEKIVAVNRIKFGQGAYAHVAELCSTAVDDAETGKGYGKLLYQELEKVAQKAGCTRVQLTQSGGNWAAFRLSQHYTEEAVFPDWLQRQENGGCYYLIERHLSRFFDPEIISSANTRPSLKYLPQLPSIIESDNISIVRTNNQFECRENGKHLLTALLELDDSVIPHVGFLTLIPAELAPFYEACSALTTVQSMILSEGRVKKVELLSHDPFVLKLCEMTGFIVRGEKKASYCDQGVYKNELAVEYSFFNVEDAKKLIQAKIKNPSQKEALLKAFEKFQRHIKQKIGDPLRQAYLENLAYQIVRDQLHLFKVVSLKDTPWQALIGELPQPFEKDLRRIQHCFKQHYPGFFIQNEKVTPVVENLGARAKL